MWKAAFTGRSESGGGAGASVSGRSSKDTKDESKRKKSSHRAESVISSTSRRDDDRERERRRNGKASSVYENGSAAASRYDTASSFASPNTSAYATAPTSRVGETRPLTESALRMLPDDDDDWEDEDKDARSERKSKRKGSGDEKRRKSSRREKERSRSWSRERKEKKKKESSRTVSGTERTREDKDRSRRQPEIVSEGSRAIPEMGSFEQFPGQYAGGYMGPAPQQEAMMSGALPSPAPQQQFPGQDLYRPQMPAQPTRADSYGHAAEYYLDEGQSVDYQPGNRPFTPNMLVNPDTHLQTASSQPNPAQDTGHGSAADFFNGKVSPVYSAPVTPAKPLRPGKQQSSSTGKISKPSRTSSASTAAAAMAAAGGVGAMAGSSHQHSSSMQQSSSSNYQQTGGSTSRPTKSSRPSSDGEVYYAQPSANGTYPPTLSSTQGYGPQSYTNTAGISGKQSTNSNIPLYAAGAAGAAAAGFAAHQYSQHHQHSTNGTNGYNMAAAGGYGGGQGPPNVPRPGAGGYGYYPPNGAGGGLGMQHHHMHEHKGPLTRLKDGFFNLISSPEDTAKMEMYTEYIGVCKHCFDPRTSPGDAPRVHHYHKRRDSFEDLRRRRSYDRISRKGSNDSLRRQGGVRVDKDHRYYASDSSRRKRESGGVGVLGAGLAAAGAAAGANALFGDRKNFDDTYSVKSGHRESSAVRRRSRSSSREQRRRSTYGTVRPQRDEFVTVRRKDGTLERRRVQRSRSTSRDRKSGDLGAATAGAALGAAGLAASSRYRSKSRSRSRSPTILGSFGAADVRSRRDQRKSSGPSSHHGTNRYDHEPEESQGIFGGFFSPPQRKRRGSREHQRQRKGFFTFSNGSSSSSNSDMAFGEGFSSKTSLPLRRKASSGSNRTGRRRSRRNSDDHIAATVAGIGATAAALAAAKKGNRISKRSSRPELGRRRDVRYSTGSDRRHDETLSSDEGEWEDELPSDVDDDSSVDGGLAFGDYGGKRLSSRQSLESVGSQSSAGGLGAWGWRWGGKDKKRRAAKPPSHHGGTTGSFAGPAAAGMAAGAVAVGAFDSSRPLNKPVYLDDTGRPLPSMDSSSTPNGPSGPMQYVDPAPISESGSMPGSRYSSMPGAFDNEPPIIRPGPAPLQQPQPMSPARAAFTQSPPDMDDARSERPGPLRRSNSSPTRGSFAQDAALIGAGALATAGILAGSSGKRSREPSNVRFGLTDEQQRKEDRDRRRQDQKSVDEERRRADRTRALKEEADRAAREARQEEVRRAREEENRKAAEIKLERERAAAREAEEQARRDKEREVSRIERERLEQEVRDREEAAAAAAAEVERHQKAREEAERQAEARKRERREWEEAYAKEQSRLAEDERRNRADPQREFGEYDQSSAKQSDGAQQDRSDKGRKSSSAWGTAAAGAAAAATVGAVMAGREHKKSRSRKSRDSSYYDDGHSDWQGRGDEDERQAELDRRAREQYGRSPAGVEYRDGYAAAEIRPEHEHQGEPLMDDDLYNPDFFKQKHTPAENAKYAEFARKAADKVVADREGAYEEKTTYADFFAPKDLLAKKAEGKTRSVSPIGDNDVQVWHATDPGAQPQIRSSDYGYGRSKHAPYGVPKLNVISPTPPPGSKANSPEGKRGRWAQSASPLSKTSDDDFENADTSGKSERSRSITWGEDSTHIYDVQTPDSYQERDSYINSSWSDSAKAGAAAAGVAGAAAAGAALHDIVVEDPSGGKRTFHEDEEARDEKESGKREGKSKSDKKKKKKASPSPGPDPSSFYQQPFFESVSDMGTGIFGMDSPGTEGAPPQRGFVEGETDEATPAEEKRPHIPGGFEDEMDDIYRPKRTPTDPVTAEIEKEQAAAGATEEQKDVEEPEWEPPLSKKEKKKREKAAKRASLAESDPATPTKEDESAPLPSSAAVPEAEPVDYFSGMSKKEKKTAKKQGFADIASAMMNEPEPETKPEVAEVVAPSVDEWEPPLSKKEQKKRDKEAKKQGQSFADVTDSILAAGGIAAAAAAVESTEDSGSGSGKKKKGKKAKLGEPMYDDPRDASPSEAATPPQESKDEPAGMPGGWDSDLEWKSRTESVDPFQYQVNEESAPPAAPELPSSQEADPWAEFAEPKSKKKKNKRSSIAFNVPEVSSPLRSEVPMDDYVGAKDLPDEDRKVDDEPQVNGSKADSVSVAEYKSTDNDRRKSSDEGLRRGDSIDSKSEKLSDVRQISPDDSRSVVSAPTPDESRRKSRREHSRGGDYFDEPSYAYETGSVAASEPADIYESSRKSKRRSRHADDDDTASVVSSRSRREREKEGSPTSSKKEKKGGIFGLFRNKSTDDYKSSSSKSKDSRSDGASLSRESTRDSRGSRDDEDDESRRRRKKKSRDSEYGDDDDTRSVKSESRRSRHRSEDSREDEGRERRRRSYQQDDYDATSPVRSESGRKHHHRRRTDDDGDSLSRRGSHDDSRSAVSESGRRHHHRRRTDEDAYRSSSRDQSFLGMRVEDLPPLPDSRPVSPDSAAEKQERGEGSPADVESGSGLVKNSDEPDALVAPEAPETPVAALETPSRPGSLNRPVSSTAVPVRFPFGHAPSTPGSARDRSHSFTSPTSSTAPPTSPASAKQSRQGRPNSTEFRPLYLVERNRKTPEVEDALPSLPSSKPSSRASSIHGSDEYQSAAEELESDSPSSRGLTIDTGAAAAYQAEDYLDSQETTPKASEFPHTIPEKRVKQEPQFYTWEDFAREERMHDQESLPEEPVTATREQMPAEFPPLAANRSKSPSKQEHGNGGSFKSVAAAAMLGTAAVYAHHQSKDRSPERSTHESSDRELSQDQASYSYPLPAPVEGANREVEPVEEPSVSRKDSKKKKKGKKGKAQAVQDAQNETPPQEASLAESDTVVAPENEVQSAQDDNIFPSAASHTLPFVPAADESAAPGRGPEQDVESGPSAQEGTGAFNQYEIPSAKAEPAPPVVEERTAEAGGEEEPSGISAAPQLTRKQSKKAKKKQKAAALFEPLEGETPDSEEPVKAPEETEEHTQNGPSAQEQVPQLRFGMSDFHDVAQQSPSSWQDSQAQAFQSMLQGSEMPPGDDRDVSLDPVDIDDRKADTIAADADEPEQQTRDDPFEPAVSRKKAKKDKKKKRVSWAEPDAEAEEAPREDVDPQSEEPAPSASNDNGDAGAIIAGGLAGAGGVAGVAGLADKKSKKKAKKDKKKAAFSWTDLEEDNGAEAGTEADLDTAPGSAAPEQPAEDFAGSLPDQTSEAAEQTPEAERLDEAVQDRSIDLVDSAEGREESREADPPFMSKKLSKKDKKKQKKAAAFAEPEPEPEQESGSRRESVDETAFVDATESQPNPGVDIGDDPKPSEDFPQDSTISEEPPVPDAESSQAELDTFAPVSSKKSKKDKKKKKAQAWSESEPQPEPEPEPESASRDPSFDDDAAFVDANETQLAGDDEAPDEKEAPHRASEVADVPPVDESSKTEEPIATPAEVNADEESFDFAPVSKKKSKKDKKKKSVSFDWNALDDDEPSDPPTSQAEPGEVGNEPSQPPELAPAADQLHAESEGQPGDKDIERLDGEATQPSEGQPEGAANEDESFESVPTSKKKSKKDKKKKKQAFDWTEPDLESSPTTDAQAEPVSDTRAEGVAPEDKTEPVEAVLPPELNQDTQLDEPEATTAALDKDALAEEAAPEPELEELKSAIKKKSKKDKKRRQTLEWTEPEPSPAAADGNSAEAPDEDAQPALDESQVDRATGPSAVHDKSESLDADQRFGEESAPTPMESKDEARQEQAKAIDDASDNVQESEKDAPSTAPADSTPADPLEPTIEDFAPAVSKKKSKKDKKKRQTFDWDEPKPEVPGSQMLDTIQGNDNAREVEQDVPATTIDEAKLAKPSEPALEDFAPAVSKKKSKKEKKKQAFDWTEPEPEMPGSETPDPARDEDNAQTAEQELAVTAPTAETPVESSEPKLEDFAPAVSKKKSKKDKMKKALGWTELEPEVPASEKPDTAVSAEAAQPSDKEADVSGEQEAFVETPKDIPEVSEPVNDASAAEAATALDSESQPEPFEETTVSRKQSKKDKKKKKRQSQQDWEPEAEVEDPSAAKALPQEQEQPSEATSQPQDISQNEALQVTDAAAALVSDERVENESGTSEEPQARNDEQDVVGQDKAQPDTSDAREMAQDTKDLPQEDQPDEWSWGTTSKKSKKNKKGRKSMSESVPPEEPSAEPPSIAAGDLSMPTEIKGQSWDDMVTEEQAADVEPATNEETAADAKTGDDGADEFAWAMPSKKKGKKGKKKSLQLDAPASSDEPAQSPMAEPLVAEAAAGESLLENAPNESVAQTQSDVQSRAADVAETEASEKDVSEDLEAGHASKSTDQADPDDIWAVSTSSKKKGKKGKKSKTSGTATPVHEAPLPDEGEALPEISAADATAKQQETPTADKDQEVDGPPAEDQQDDLWAAPSKKKKGKKGKAPVFDESAFDTPDKTDDVAPGETTGAITSTDAAVGEPEAPAIGDAQETADTPAAEEEQDDFWSVSSKNKKKGKKGKTSIFDAPAFDTTENADDVVPDETTKEPEPASAQEPDTAPVETPKYGSAEPAAADDDMWAAFSSKKKKSKKNKKSASVSFTPPAEEEPQLPREVVEDSTPPVDETADPDVKQEGKTEAALEAEPALDETEATTAADPTFDDVWAEEDIVTHDDHDAVRDLVADPSETPEASWQPLSSKKSKKKKGKRGSVAAPLPPEEPDPSKQIEEPISEPHDVAMEDTTAGMPGSWEEQKDDVGHEPSATVEQDQSSRDIVMADAQELTTEEPSVEPAQEDDWSAPQASKKSKKGKKNKQSYFDDNELQAEPADKSEPVESATTESAAKPDAGEAEPEDVWAVPTKSKKGKKGKKAKQSLSWEDSGEPAKEDEPVVQGSGLPQDENPLQAPEFEQPIDREVPIEEATEQPLQSDEPLEALKATLPTEPKTEEQVDPLATDQGEAAEQKTTAPEEENNDFSFTTKKSKKEKKKDKKKRASAADAWTEPASEAAPNEETPAENDNDKDQLAGAAAAATAVAAGAVALESTTQEPQEDEWASFSTKKSKKDKKKAKKSGLSTPTVEEPPRSELSGDNKDVIVNSNSQDGAKPAFDTEDAEQAWSFPENQKAEGDAKEGSKAFEDNDKPAHATSEPAELPRDGDAGQVNEEPEFVAQDRQNVSSEPATTDTPHHPPQDIDFTATVAAGLADSGFDPDMVINDPVFHRRASPTGSNGEADPEETSSLTTTRRRRSKKSPEAAGSPEQRPATPANEAANDSVPADDFNVAVSESLTRTGFDPALLERSLASSNDQASGEAAGDAEDFSFTTTSKRKKGKKGEKSKVASETDAAPVDDAQPIGLDGSVESTKRDHGSGDAMTMGLNTDEQPPFEAALQDDSTPMRREVPQSPAAEGDNQAISEKQTEPADKEVNLLNVGHDEMDMDEMDRQYKEYRRNKRKQKKLKAAAKAAGSSDNPESSTAVSESDALSPRGAKGDTLARSVMLDEAIKTQSSEQEQPPEEVQSPSSQTNKQSVVQSAFPGLERVKRRAPSIPSANENRDRRSSSGSQGLLQHTSEVSQLLPVAVPRSPPRSDPDKRDSNEGWTAAAGTAGFGAAIAAAARERQARKSAATGPSWSFDALDAKDKAVPASPEPTYGEHQPIRDSGYQEGKRSSKNTERSSREIPEILHTSSSRDSLRERRSLDPLRISMEPDNSWDTSSPGQHLDDGRGRATGHSRTPSAETPLKPTSKDRASYLFQSPPDVLAGAADTTPRAEPSSAQQKSPDGEYFKTRSTSRGSNEYQAIEGGDRYERSSFSLNGPRGMPRDRSAFSPPGHRDASHDRSALSQVHSPRSPNLPLDAIPEELHVGKRRKADSDVGGPSQIKAIQRAETPQAIRARQHTTSPPSIETRMKMPVGATRSTSNPLSTDTLINRLSWPSVDEDQDTVHIDRPLGHRYSKPALPDPRSPSVMSNRSNASGAHFKSPHDLRSYSRNSNRSETPSLRRTSLSGDLRAASRRGDGSAAGSGSAVGGAAASPKTIPFEPPPTPPLNDDELAHANAHASASRAVDMNDDVFVSDNSISSTFNNSNDAQQGYGDAQQSQVSPTRPPSVRKRQSMHITDLETRINELAAENRALHEARQYADQTHDVAREVNGQALQEALAARDQQLRDKDAEIDQIKAMLQPLQEEVARLTEINGGLTEANRNLVDDTNGRYATLQAEHTEAHEKWQSASRELESMRSEHGRVTSGMRDIIEAEIASSLADKNAEILRLREQLDIAAEQIRSLQVQIQSSKSSDWLVQRDEDYFDGACQKLCQHVQQWVLRFSKLSDNRVCRLSTDLKDDKLEARLDNAILDGSDVDKLLSDRVRRRDVFMSVVMTMVWEYVFTRYLFGMDREQRQKLKVLEKTLAETGPPRSVAHWRATTLTLLSKRPAFATQCGLDTEAVSHEIFNMLCSLLPPPQNAEQQLFASLQKVMGVAVNLSIEMRTQRAEYIMLPPLQPEYDTNGDLVRKVHFNADLMNERSGFFSSNEELAADHAVVKIVLFPLVVKKGDDHGEGEEEIVVCPAQVLVQNDGGRGKKVVRVMSGALPMDIDQPMGNRPSRHSLVSDSPGGSMQF